MIERFNTDNPTTGVGWLIIAKNRASALRRYTQDIINTDMLGDVSKPDFVATVKNTKQRLTTGLTRYTF